MSVDGLYRAHSNFRQWLVMLKGRLEISFFIQVPAGD